MTDANADTSSHTQHRRCAAKLTETAPARCAVLTISDSRTEETDRGGPLIRELLEAGGHRPTVHAIVKDEPQQIRSKLQQWIDDAAVDAIITTGGTGLAKRDGTIAVVSDLIDVEIDGFGELFRMISFEQIGAAAMLSRAMAGLVTNDDPDGDGTFLFALPGSVNAIRTAMQRLIVPELGHLVMHRRG